MKNKIGFSLLVFLSFGFTNFHPFYLSMSEINFNSKEKLWEISLRIFTDDLEKEIRHHCGCRADLLNSKDSVKNSQLLNNYFQKTWKINTNGKPNPLKIIGFEKEEESIWTYFESRELQKPKEVEFEVGILYETQPLQTNLVRLKVGKFDETRQLVYPKRSLHFTLD